MKLEQVKKAEDVKLDGITVIVDKNASGIMNLTLTDAAGNLLRIDQGSYELIKAWVPAAKKTERRFVLTGIVYGAEYRHGFKTQVEALSMRTKIEENFDGEDPTPKLAITEEQVEVED